MHRKGSLRKKRKEGLLGIHNLGRKQLALTSDPPHHCVDVPMIVEIDDTRHRASEWKVSGFTLDKPLPALSPGDVRTAHIGLRISDLDIAFDIPCQVVRTIQMGAVDFQFLGAFTAQAALLHRIAEDHLAGHVTELDTLLRSSPTRRSPRKRRRFLLVALVS